MNGLTRSLHPDREAAQYVPCWTGDSWRSVEWAGAVLIPAIRSPQTMQEALLAALTDRPQSVTALASAAGLSYRSAEHLLGKLVQRERAIRARVPVKGWARTRSVLRYAKAGK